MFNFMKKTAVLTGGDVGGGEERDGEKERRKREKKERKEREKKERQAAGMEEPLRLEEVRRSLKLRGRRKEKEKLPSGITADYTASLFAHLEHDSNYFNYPLIPTSGSNSNLSDENNHLSPGYPSTHTWNKREGVLQSDSSETSLNSLNNPNNANSSPRQPPNLPPIPPRPPKRGILKGPRLSNTSSNSVENNVQSTDAVDNINGQDTNLLARNTQQNELISYGIPPSKSTSSSDDMQHVQNFTKKVIHSPVETQYKNYKNGSSNPSITTQDVDEAPKTNGNSYLGVTSTSPSADSLTDTTTNSSFATPPFSTSPVGESQGFHRWSRTSNFEDVYLPLPGLTPLQLPKPRLLTIQRQKAPRNDFGFSLRRAMIQERIFIGDVNGHDSALLNGDNKCGSLGMVTKLTFKAVILAEPGSYPGASETGLLPGDRLLEVNGVNVEEKSREEVIDLIKGSQDSVTIKVQPIAELCELSRRRAADGGGDVELSDSNVRGGTLSRSGSRRFTTSQAKSEEQLACEKEWLQTGHMWLAHRGGFTAVVREGEADAGRAKVRVLQTGEILTVDEDDLEKANPPQLERCEDIASLRCLNECGALNVLRSRFAAGLPHARAGHALLVLGPPKRTAPIYTEKVAAMFRGCRLDDMPPHVFAAAQATHRCMLASRRDRAIVFLGRSGSGKTSAMRHCVWYLASAYPAQGSKLTPERLDAAFDVLHMFGSSRTGSNPHASRFVSLTSLDFDGGGALAAASVQTLLPDLRPGQTPLKALHVLYHGCDGRLRRELLFDQAPVNSPNPFLSPSDKADAAEFSALKDALQLLAVTEQEQMAIWKIMAAICHLGWAGAVKANTGSGIKYQFASTGCGQRAARLLGVGAEELARAVFATVPTSPQPNSNLRTPSPSNEREMSGTEAVDAFVTGLYNETFNIIAALVNRSLSTSARTSASILLLDTPGADNPMCAGQQSGAPLSKLLSNYLQERLQAMFHEAMLVAPRERYAQEGITLDDGAEEDWLSETVNPGPMVELLDKAPQNTIVRSSQADLRDCDRRGLLWLLDEESMYPGSSDDTFLERALAHLGAHAPHAAHALIKKAPHARQFVLQHLQGTNPVLYDVTGWVKASRENPVTKKALTLLQESQNEEIGRLSSWSRGACGISAWSAAVGDANTLRRASSIRRTLTSGTAGMKRRSTALQAKFVADGVIDTLRRCGAAGVSFVCCLLTCQPNDAADDVNVPLLRSQFRGFQLLDAARLYKQGFPEHMPLSEFARRYRLLATSESEDSETPQQNTLSDRQIVDDMLLTLDLDVTSYRLGLTQNSLSNIQLHAEANTLTEDPTPLQCFPFDDSKIFGSSHDCEITGSKNSNKENVDLTPRKRKMKRHIDHLIHSLSKKKKEVKRLQDKNRLLVKKNADLKEILNTLTKKSYITQENEDILSSIGVQNQEIVKRQILKTKKGHIPKIKYSPELRAFSLTLHFYSPKAYNFVRQTFSTCLPATSTLRSWYQSIDGKPGFTKEAIDTIKMKARESKHKIYATIIFDEMAIRSGIEYHPQSRKYYGHVSFGANLQSDCQDEAKEALVFLLVPINASWKIPIGYFLINGINADQKAALLTEAIHLIEGAGVNVKAITFDGCPTNITMAKKLGCSFEVDQIKSTFKNPCNHLKIAVFLDPAHMIKLVRNAFEFYRNFKDEHGNIISWQYLVKLHNLQTAENFHLANRLRAAHIFFKSKIMKVSLATQIFSKSVSDALKFCKEQLNLHEFQEVIPTIQFLDMMNGLFDILDSHTHGYDLKRAINAENAENVVFKLQTAKHAILNMSADIIVRNVKQKVQLVKSPRYTGFIGFCVCIESAIALIQDLVLNSECDIKYLPLHKISQDHLEHLFGTVRCHGGSNNNPSARVFESIYKKLLTYAQIKNSGSGNCSALGQISILQCTSAVNRINITTRYKDQNTDLETDSLNFSDLESLYPNSEFGEKVVEYMSGYIVHALIKQIKCQTCIGALIGIPNKNALQYQKDLKNKLLYGSNTVIEICRRCEIYIKRAIHENGSKVLPPKYNTAYFIRSVLKSLIGYNLFPDINFHQFEIESTNHLIELARCIIQKYVDARLSFFTKSNQDPRTLIRKTHTKLIHFKNQ